MNPLGLLPTSSLATDLFGSKPMGLAQPVVELRKQDKKKVEKKTEQKLDPGRGLFV